MSALRLVVLEWQDRSKARVLEGYTEEEAMSVQQVLGDANFGASQFARSTFAHSARSDAGAKSDSRARRARLVRIYLVERECLLGVSCILVAAGLNDSPPAPGGKGKGREQASNYGLPWLQSVLEKLTVAGQGKQKSSNPERRIQSAIDELNTAIKAWDAGVGWLADLDDGAVFSNLFRTSQMTRILLILKLLCIHVGSLQSWATASNVQSWFELMDNVNFLDALAPQSADQQTLVGPIKALAAIISLQLLRLSQALGHLDEESPPGRPIPYIYDGPCREQVNNTLANAAGRNSSIASLALLTWAVILQTLRERVQSLESDDDSELAGSSPVASRPRISGTAPPGLTEALETVLQSMPDGDPIDLYARAAVDGCSVLIVSAELSRVLETVMTFNWISSAAVHTAFGLFELLRQAILFLNYTDETVGALIALLEGNSTSTQTSSQPPPVRAALAERFVRDEKILVPRLLHQAQARYPNEILPLLQLSNALAVPGHADRKGILPLASDNPYFCFRLPHGFQAYETAREEENANIITLKEDIPLFIPRRKFSTIKYENTRTLVPRDEDDAPLMMRIPAGTTGQVISDDRPYLVKWDHTHSIVQYLACLLASEAPNSKHRDVANDGVVDLDVQSEIVALFANLVEAHIKPDDDHEEAKEFLQDASEYLGRNADIISIVFDIFEEHLSQRQTRNDSSVALLINCIEFFRMVLPILPGRIWPLLARGELLGVEGNGGRLASVIGSTDTISSRIKLVVACNRLADALVHDIVRKSATTRNESRVVAKRFKSSDDRTSGLPQRLTSKIVFSFTQILLSVFESTQSWPIEASASANEIRLSITSLLDYVLVRAYACGELSPDAHGATDGLCSALVPSAKLILETFLGSGTGHLFVGRLWSTFATDTDSVRNSALRARSNGIGSSAILTFLTNLLKFSVHYDNIPSQLARNLFQTLPLIVRGYVSGDEHKVCLLRLLSAIIREAGASEQEPPSLLGQLGADTAKAFLVELQHFDQPMGITDLEMEVWNLAAHVVSNKQQWVASFLINGDTPKHSIRNRQTENGTQIPNSSNSSKALLHVALERLSKRSVFHDSCSTAMLKFVVGCQNHYPSVSTTIRQSKTVLDKLLDYVVELRTSMSRDELEQTRQTAASSHIADLVAMYVHNMRQLGNADDFDNITSKLGFYRENGLALPDYNESLHLNLKRNFEKRYDGCTLDSFRRRTLSTEFGRSYYYDLEFASEVLGQSPAWHGTKGFEEELARANINMSLVESQVLLMRSWESLVIEVSHQLTGRDALQKHMINIVNHCLTNNVKSSNHTALIHEQLMQRRADLALVLLQRLINVRCRASSFKTLLSAAWDMVRSSGEDFEVAFTSSNAEYYRTTLQVLLLTLQSHTYVDTPEPNDSSIIPPTSLIASPDTLPILIEITTAVICTGFRSLCTQLHAAPTTVSPSDLALIIGLLQTILRIPHIATSHNTLSLRISDTGVHRYALALFSWSDRLLTSPYTRESTSNDRIASNLHALTLADLATSFLHTLSSIPPLAVFLGTENILSQLASAPLLAHLRSTSPQTQTQRTAPDQPQHTRLTLLYTRSILPLVLNLLTAIGPSFAPEALSFLCSFPSQLSRASRCLSPSVNARIDGAGRDVFAGAITLAMVREVHTLSLLSLGLSRAVQAGLGIGALVGGDCGLLGFAYANNNTNNNNTTNTHSGGNDAAGANGNGNAAPWDSNKVQEDAEAWLGSRRNELRSRIRACSEWEEELMGTPTAAGKGGSESECGNRLEEMVVGELGGVVGALGGVV